MAERKDDSVEKGLGSLLVLALLIGNMFLESWFLMLIWRWHFQPIFGRALTLGLAFGTICFVDTLRSKNREKKTDTTWDETLYFSFEKSLGLCLILLIAWIAK